ncbi:hypothetical protein C8T65DRAFT_744236 [Cerioporus squamosus]|nr:hypothetical protein C8T65DRAFT_744236 [Cerioporus squamosus]
MDSEHWKCTPPTTTDLIPWQPAPDFRSTFSIFTSCLATLIICVWSALHVDISTGRSIARQYLSKFGWVFVGLFCPELLFYIAFNQFKMALLLTLEAQIALPVAGSNPPRSYRILARLLGVKGDGQLGRPEGGAMGNEPRKHPWTLAHGFYAAMGGFVLKDPYAPPSDDNYLPAWQMNGPSVIPDLAYDDIVDRSKADGFAKALLLWQVSWFLLTCIVRHAQGLQLSLLEVTTIAHAACTLLTYLVWWEKPKDVAHQTAIIESQDVRPLCAWLSMSSSATVYLLGGLVSYHAPSENFLLTSVRFLETRRRSRLGATTHTVPSRYPLLENSAHELRTTNTRRTLASEVGTDMVTQWESTSKDYVVPVASLQAYNVNLDYVVGHAIIHFPVIAISLGAVYGLPHLAGLTVTFPSETERTLWLVAIVLVAATGFVLCLTFSALVLPLLWIQHYIGRHGHFLEFHLKLESSWQKHVYHALLVVFTILYLFSSGYLVVESLRQLFALPPAAFDLPSWGRYWPHFS